jgi:hypothetical protein
MAIPSAMKSMMSIDERRTSCSNGMPARVQTDVDDDTEDADLVFLDHPLRKQPIPLTVLEKACSTETPKGKAKGTTCATCGICWKD